MISVATTVTILAAAHIGSGWAAKPAGAPHVVSTRPAEGAVVPAGPVSLTVTFDRPMRRASYSFVYASPDTYPECGDHVPVQSADGLLGAVRQKLRSFVQQSGLQKFHERRGCSGDAPSVEIPGEVAPSAYGCVGCMIRRAASTPV